MEDGLCRCVESSIKDLCDSPPEYTGGGLGVRSIYMIECCFVLVSYMLYERKEGDYGVDS